MITINSNADYKTEQKYGPIHGMRVWRLWAVLYLLIAGIGAYILSVISPLRLLLVLSILLVLGTWATIRWPDIVTRIVLGREEDSYEEDS
jgi:hypothetical protein